jgi:hypothetical protein
MGPVAVFPWHGDLECATIGDRGVLVHVDGASLFSVGVTTGGDRWVYGGW